MSASYLRHDAVPLGFEPHTQSDSAVNGNWRRICADSSSITVTPEKAFDVPLVAFGGNANPTATPSGSPEQVTEHVGTAIPWRCSFSPFWKVR
jgi:hypothetical protein